VPDGEGVWGEIREKTGLKVARGLTERDATSEKAHRRKGFKTGRKGNEVLQKETNVTKNQKGMTRKKKKKK